MTVKPKPADGYFSKLIRERADWRCEICGQKFTEETRGGLHCSHHVSRVKLSVRWSPLNASAHCASCHKTMGDSPLLHAEWIMAHLGAKSYARLKIQAERLMPLKKHDHKEIIANLKASLKHMQSQREAGETGRLEFESPYPERLVES
jgi:hypothetical protein